MINIKLKNFILNFITVFVATLITLLIINFVFIKISTQKYFPRSLAGSLPNILLTFHPDTYQKDSLEYYVAILGDSYSQGGGDAYLSGAYDYSFGHHLYKDNKKNYLNFGRAGYGSISAVSNLIKINHLTNLPNSIENLKKPESIIFFFYEGNDLEENIFEYNSLVNNEESIPDFVSRRIEENLKFDSNERIKNIFPLLTFSKKMYLHLNRLFKEITKENDLVKIKSLIAERVKKLLGHTIILNSKYENKLTYINTVKNNNKIKNIRPLQSAAVGLNNEEISIALQIFFESIKYLKSWSQIDKIVIVYIPSTISSYNWNDPIVYEQKNQTNGDLDTSGKKTFKEKNSLNSKFMRNSINNFATQIELQFLDTTDFIYEKGKEQILHGPLDWRHFNFDGYKAVSNFINKKIEEN